MGHQMENHIRFVALATILANARDLADWLGIAPQNCFNFDDRTYQLDLHPVGFEYHQRKIRLLAMSKHIFNNLKTYAMNYKPVMIYTSDRKTAKNVALDLLTHAIFDDNPKMFFKYKNLKE